MGVQAMGGGHGIEWLKQAVGVIQKNPVAFLVMGLIVAILAMIPLINLVVVILMPTFYAGIAYAARQQESGGAADIKHVFQGFSEPGRMGPLLTLCLPYVAVGLVVGIAAMVIGFGAVASAGLASGAEPNMGAIFGAMGAGLFVVVALGIAGAVIAMMLTVFAVPLVMFEGRDAFPAMKESFAAASANLIPLIVFVVLIFVAILAITVLLGGIPVLGVLIMLAVLATAYALIGIAHWLCYRDVFGGRSAVASSANVMPPPPPA